MEVGKTRTRPAWDIGIWRYYRAHRYAILFFTLLFTLVVMPILTVLKWNASIIEFLLALSLLAAVSPIDTNRARAPLLGLIILVLIARAMVLGPNQIVTQESTLGIWSVIGLLAAAQAMRVVITADDVASEHVFAALSAYLLAGVFFGLAYFSIEQAWPASFAGPEPLDREGAIYFSFVTLASLGYGDFLPKSDIARGLAIFEVIGGQLFLAVLVARLISLYTMREEHDGHK